MSAKLKSKNQKPFKIRLKKGDTVTVRSGKYKGQTSKITAVHPKHNKVTVEGINVVKKHLKPTRERPSGGIVDITKPIWVSKVGLADPGKANRPSRIGYKMAKNGEKTRYYKTSGKEVK